MARSDWDIIYPSRRPSEAAVGSFSTRVYGWMTVGLLFTAMIAYAVFATGLYAKLMPFWWVWAFGTLGVGMLISFRAQRMSVGAMTTAFMVYSGLEGIFMGTLLPAFAFAYGGQVIWSAFATAGLIFGMAACYGIFTKSDLTKLSRILSFALIGLIVVSLIYFVASFFIHLTWMTLLISYLGLVIFTGLTAYDAHQIRQMAYQVEQDSTLSQKLSLMMALRMYINVIMIFWYLLQIFASSRRS